MGGIPQLKGRGYVRAVIDGGSAGDQFARDPESKPILVSGIRVHAPLTERQADMLAPFGLLADEPRSLLVAWKRIDEMWTTTVGRARRLPP